MVEVYPEGKYLPLTAGADITAGQVVELTGDKTVAPTGGASSKVIGVALINANAGENVTIVTEGVVEVVAAGAIAAGDKVQSAAGGKVAKFSATKTYTDSAGNTVDVDDATKIIGIALTSASADGDKILVKLTL
ncbi:capsid cement protein [Archaeoglobus profundus]|uniref:DUF2190 family protein n=1 Tax=Archaeoglobus profundus (strain DSM 5631 / JCM 9629 / NBRC 100127 / Av18) TaxID=572546 RepID=D2REK6_ARCPA|nr:capsid cement protein [Archaeoglobus profundus]ADB58550.1 hypothetical protein Arcpr_1504 [Archaeoglobus profundus DSM 5631]